MAEETPGVQNKGMLIVSLVLAALLVVVYNLHVSAVRSESRGTYEKVIRVVRDIRAGETLNAADIEVIDMNSRIVKRLGNVVKASEQATAVGMRVTQPVRRGELLMWAHLTGEQGGRPSATIRQGYQGVPLDIDPRWSPGGLLQQGDTVDVIGIISLQGKPPKAYVIVPSVQVCGIAGVPNTPERVTERGKVVSNSVARRYRSITVEIRPDQVLPLMNVLTHVEGGVRVVVRRQGEKVPPNAGLVNPTLADLPAKRSTRGGSYSYPD